MDTMLQAYQGYFKENGQFISLDRKNVKIPTNKKLIITILDDNPVDVSVDEPVDKKAILASLKGIIPPDVDLETARDERRAKRGLLQ